MLIPATFAHAFRKRRDGSMRTPDECMRLCAEAGFKYVDWSPNFDADGWEDDVDKAIEAAKKYGITIIQSHTPYNYYKKLPLEVFQKQLEGSIDAARKMGVKDLVFHFDEYQPIDFEHYNAKEGLKAAYDVLAPYVIKTTECGINAALETIFEVPGRIQRGVRGHFGGVFEELKMSLDAFKDNDKVTCCWDFGHSDIGYKENHADYIKEIGSKISCTHVHDNYYETDLHLVPFLGNLQWEKLIPALKETGYDGYLTYEPVYGTFPDEILPTYIKLVYESMKYLCEKC